jgi:ATP-dependent RNA helicase SUPV3L1/SUV3
MNNISAILGPTNTGKTFFAIKKMLKCNNGVIGFPLRLLARENYEYTKRIVGESKVALITGEEKIIPKAAKYFFCTVESIPENYSFDYVGIDEIQLASDFERGYVFTDKLLNILGNKETVFMGSISAEKILKKIYPDIKILKKNRLSKLTYSGYKNIARLPKRSAVIAFSQLDLYQFATRIKQIYGGVSIVMGALSPEVRNAQVKMFEDGKVDYIVATDAIGLGMNLDIKHVFFSSLVKFDGHNKRKLTFDELAQIAGRAGRYLNDGFFGTTGNQKLIGDEIVKFVENYNHLEIKNFYWRNSKITFQHPKELIKNLSKRPEEYFFKLKRNASDERYFKILIGDSEVKKEIKFSKNLKILWDVCGIPDYSKNLDEHHSAFLKIIFLHLARNKKIPEELIKSSLSDIEKKTNKVAELNYKLSQIRIWSFISFKENWLDKNDYYKNKVKQIETNLSNRLHTELISLFIDENKELVEQNDILKSDSLIKVIKKDIMFGREKVGNLEGLRFRIDLKYERSGYIFQNKILKNYLNQLSKSIVDNFVESKSSEFKYDVSGKIYWKNDLIGRLTKAKDMFKPKINILSDYYFSKFNKVINTKLEDIIYNKILSPLLFLDKNLKNSHNQNVRAINFNLYENFGHCIKKEIIRYYQNLEKNDYFTKKIKIGRFFIFYENQTYFNLKQMLVNIYYEGELLSYMNKKFYKLENDKITNNRKIFYERIGFYIFKIKNKPFLIYYQYLEEIFQKISFSRKRNRKFNPKNSLESLLLKNPNDLVMP